MPGGAVSGDGPSRDAVADGYDVVVVGGGPAGCSAGVFTARAGLDTVVFDRGNSSLRRCAYLENYLGFPGGVAVETFLALARDHAEAAGCDVVEDLVESVEPGADGEGFVVDTQEGRSVTADSVVAATRYGGEYLRPVAGEDAFETHEHDGDEHEHFNPDYADADGRTPVDGLYVASPAGERDVQAIVAAGQGAYVARTLLADRRRDEGYPAGVLANRYDWLRPDAEFEGEWGERDRWHEWFDDHVPEDADLDPDRLTDLRERAVDGVFDTHRTAAEVADLTAAGQRRLADHLDAEVLADSVDDETLLDAVADERIVARARELAESDPD